MLSEVKEQNEGVRFLQRIIDGQLSSPLLLVGPEGVGRKFSIVEAARTAFAADGDADVHNYQIDKGVHPDLIVVQPEDQKDLGVEAIRNVIEQASFAPTMATMRFVIIDGADSMTVPAANAFLKTLEEPPRNTRFFLLAEAGGKVLPTIRSRCGIVRYTRLSEAFVVEQLLRQTDDPTKALVYARLSEGSVGRALQFLGSGRLTLRDEMVSILKNGLTKDLASLLAAVGEMTGLRQGLYFLEHILHDLIMLPHDPRRISNLDIAEDLGRLRASLGEVRIQKLVDGLRVIRSREHAPINFTFHVKTYFASAFLE